MGILKKRFFWRVFGGNALVVLVFAAALIWVSFGAIRKAYVDDQAQQLTRLASLVGPEILPLLQGEELDALSRKVAELKTSLRIRITVIDAAGSVLTDSEEAFDRMDSHLYRPEVFEALKGRTSRSVRRSSTVHVPMLYMSFPLFSEGRVAGVLRLSLFMSDIEHVLDGILKKILPISIVILGLVFLMMLAFSRSVSSPIREFVATSRRVAGGDFQARVPIRVRGELGDFARSFNIMAADLQSLFEAAKERAEELGGILASVQDGLLVIEKDDRIVQTNESFRRILDNETLVGRAYWEVLRGSKFHELVRKVKAERTSAADEITLNDRIYICRASFLATRERIVVTFHDLSEFRNIERMKKDFVINLSHELRTPLATVKGFVEVLEEKTEGEEKRIVGIIGRNIDRMIAIVHDLISLARIEERGKGIDASEVDVRALVENVFSLFRPKAEEKAIALTLRSEADLPRLKGDAFELEQMLVNLIDNAVKFTEKGSVSVTLGRKAGGDFVIEVEDTGIGIEKDDLPHVFERFYVVDKSRSRKSGGTGLGLSIVKHIVLAHQGRISVKSRLGQGTTFTVSLPMES